MLLDQLLAQKGQLLSISGLDLLPDSKLTERLRQYLLACKAGGKSPKTLVVYCRFVGYFIRFLDSNGLELEPVAMTQDHINLFILSAKERGVTPETASAYFRALHTFFNWLEARNYIRKNPFFRLPAPRVPKKHVKGFPDDVLANVLGVLRADSSFVGTRNWAMALLFLDTGVRQQEMASMKLEDIYFEQGLIRVTGKGAKDRIVKMGEVAHKALLEYLMMRRDNSEAVWVTGYGSPLKQWGLNEAFHQIAERAKIPAGLKRGTHIYRHTAATSYLRNNGNLKCLQELMGHESIKTTMRYVDALGPQVVIKDHELASPVDNLLGEGGKLGVLSMMHGRKLKH